MLTNIKERESNSSDFESDREGKYIYPGNPITTGSDSDGNRN